jgi:protein-S-isoprenylcysteine O-methyltransferase Ste14
LFIAPLVILIALFGFGLLHSALAAESTKARLRRLIGARHVHGWYRVAYNILAVLTVLPALVLAVVLPDRELYRIPAPLSYMAFGGQALGLIGILYSIHQLDVMHFSGLRQVRGWISGVERRSASDTSTSRLVVDGLHRYVRHPLYTSSLIVLWLISPMTINRLAFDIGVTVYFIIGSIFEERKLVREFGDAYRDYQRRVPRLLPRLR